MNTKFDRRRFLLGSSGLIALPLFESLVSERALAQEVSKTRAIFMKFPIGVYLNSWSPAGTGTSYTLPNGLSSLEQFKSDILIPKRLNNVAASSYDPATGRNDGAGDHARSGGAYLTTVPVNKSEQTIRAGISIDRLIAEKLSLTASPNWLVLAAPGGGGGDSGYSPVYTSNISWISATTPASRVTDTRDAFQILFPTANPNDAANARKARYKKSILDGAIAEAASLNSKLGSNDKMKLDEYLNSVREVERGIANDSSMNPLACSPGTNPGSTGNDFARFTKTMMDLIVLASVCNRTRVVSYFLDYEGTNRGGINGVQEGHHTVSHHGDNSAYPGKYQAINAWYASQFAYFVGRMKATKDAMDRPLLDSSIIVYGSDIHDGNQHGHDNLPILMAGKANGQMTPGRVIDAGNRPLANLWVSVAKMMGTDVNTHGNSNGTIAL